MDAVIHGAVALIAFVATAWCFYAGIIGFVDLWKHREARPLTIFFSLMALMLALVFAWLGTKLL